MPPYTSDREICADLPGKERQGKKGKMEKKRRKIKKREGGKFKMEGGKITKWGEDFFFVLFCFPLFKTTEILFWVYQNGNFLPGKSISCRKKKSGKNDSTPSVKISSYAPESEVTESTAIFV